MFQSRVPWFAAADGMPQPRIQQSTKFMVVVVLLTIAVITMSAVRSGAWGFSVFGASAVTLACWKLKGTRPERGGAARSANSTSARFLFVLSLTLASGILDLAPPYVSYAVGGAGAIILAISRSEWDQRVSSFLAALLIVGVVGAVWGRVIDGQVANGLSFFLPACICLPALVGVGRPVVTSDRVCRVLILCSITFGLLSNVVPRFDGLAQFGNAFLHTRSYWLAAGIAIAIVLRAWWQLALLAALWVGHFVTYPALTNVIVLLIALGLVAITGTRVNGPLLTGFILVFGAPLSFLSFRLDTLVSSYFLAVGKGDNSAARSALFELGMRKFDAAPIFGSGFRENVSVAAPPNIANIDLVPLHNDLLQLAVAGGVVALVLFLIGIVQVFRRIGVHGFDTDQHVDRAARVGVLSLFAGLLATSVFNPILFVPSGGLLFGTLVVLGTSLKSRRKVVDVGV